MYNEVVVNNTYYLLCLIFRCLKSISHDGLIDLGLPLCKVGNNYW